MVQSGNKTERLSLVYHYAKMSGSFCGGGTKDTQSYKYESRFQDVLLLSSGFVR